MRIAPAADWQPEPGRVVDWIPSARTVQAAGRAERHPVGPSFLQRDHIAAVVAERAAGAVHRAYTCAAVPVAGVLDVDAMTTALTDFVREHEGWRSVFRIVDGDIERALVDPGEIELQPVIRPDVSDPVGHVHRRLPDVAVFDVFPAVAFGAIVRDDSFDLYFGIDHAYGDASSQAIGLAEILARYRGDDDGPRAVPGVGHVAQTLHESERAATLTSDSPSVQRWRDLLASGAGMMPGFPLDLGVVDGVPQPVHVEQVRIADPERTERLGAWAKSRGAGLSAAVFAALAATERRVAGRTDYTTTTVLSTRRGPHVVAQGWYINFVPMSFPVASERLGDLLDEAAEALTVARAMADDPVHGALGVLIAVGELDPSIIANPQMVSYLDFRWFPDGERLRDAVIFTGEGVTDHASLWISRTDDGLFAGTQRPANPVAADALGRYFATLTEVLAEADPLSADANGARA